MCFGHLKIIYLRCPSYPDDHRRGAGFNQTDQTGCTWVLYMLFKLMSQQFLNDLILEVLKNKVTILLVILIILNPKDSLNFKQASSK